MKSIWKSNRVEILMLPGGDMVLAFPDKVDGEDGTVYQIVPRKVLMGEPDTSTFTIDVVDRSAA